MVLLTILLGLHTEQKMQLMRFQERIVGCLARTNFHAFAHLDVIAAVLLLEPT